MIKKTEIKATTVKTFLSFFVILILLFSVGGFYFAQDKLQAFAREVNTIVASSVRKKDSSNSGENQILIDQYKGSYNKAVGLAIIGNEYESKIRQDLSQYASSAGITITNFDFSKVSTTISPINSSLQISGITPKYVTINLTNPVKFNNLIQFFKFIEKSTPKMQVNSINIASIPNSNDNITVEQLIIEFYTR